MSRQVPTHLILIPINNFLIYRPSDDTPLEKIVIRPGATEFLTFLINSGLFYLAFQTGLTRENAQNVLNKILRGIRVEDLSNVRILDKELTSVEGERKKTGEISFKRLRDTRLLAFDVNDRLQKNNMSRHTRLPPQYTVENKNIFSLKFIGSELVGNEPVIRISQFNPSEPNDDKLHQMTEAFREFAQNHWTRDGKIEVSNEARETLLKKRF